MDISDEEYRAFVSRATPTIYELTRILAPDVDLEVLQNRMKDAMKLEGQLEPSVHFNRSEDRRHLMAIARRVMNESRRDFHCPKEDVALRGFEFLGMRARHRVGKKRLYERRKARDIHFHPETSPVSSTPTSPIAGQLRRRSYLNTDSGSSSSIATSPAPNLFRKRSHHEASMPSPRKLPRLEPAMPTDVPMASPDPWLQDFSDNPAFVFSNSPDATFTDPSTAPSSMMHELDMGQLPPSQPPSFQPLPSQPPPSQMLHVDYADHRPVPILKVVIATKRSGIRMPHLRFSHVVGDDLVPRSITSSDDRNLNPYKLKYDTWMADIKKFLHYDEVSEYIDLDPPAAPHPWAGKREIIQTGRDWQAFVWAGAQQGVNPIRLIIKERTTSDPATAYADDC